MPIVTLYISKVYIIHVYTTTERPTLIIHFIKYNWKVRTILWNLIYN